jgi:hypothetical protein
MGGGAEGDAEEGGLLDHGSAPSGDFGKVECGNDRRSLRFAAR